MASVGVSIFLTFLAIDTEIRATLTLNGFTDRAAAFATRLSLALINKEFLAEIAGLAVFAKEIAQRGSPLGDRFFQYILDGFHQLAETRQG